jgi:hypothetical protein
MTLHDQLKSLAQAYLDRMAEPLPKLDDDQPRRGRELESGQVIMLIPPSAAPARGQNTEATSSSPGPHPVELLVLQTDEKEIRCVAVHDEPLLATHLDAIVPLQKDLPVDDLTPMERLAEAGEPDFWEGFEVYEDQDEDLESIVACPSINLSLDPKALYRYTLLGRLSEEDLRGTRAWFAELLTGQAERLLVGPRTGGLRLELRHELLVVPACVTVGLAAPTGDPRLAVRDRIRELCFLQELSVAPTVRPPVESRQPGVAPTPGWVPPAWLIPADPAAPIRVELYLWEAAGEEDHEELFGGEHLIIELHRSKDDAEPKLYISCDQELFVTVDGEAVETKPDDHENWFALKAGHRHWRAEAQPSGEVWERTFVVVVPSDDE